MAADLNEQLEILARELADAVDTFNKLREGTIAFGSQLENSVRSIEKLSSTVLDLNRDISRTSARLDDLADGASSAGEALEDFSDGVESSTKRQERYEESIKRILAVKQLEEEVQKRLNEAHEKFRRDLADMQFQLKRAGGEFVDTMFTQGKGFSGYANAANSALKGFGDMLISQGGLIGKVLGYTLKIIGGVAAAVGKQLDDQFKAADDITEVGVSTLTTVKQLAELGRGAGFTAERLMEFTGIVKGVGSNLGSLGNNASAGFERLAGVLSMDVFEVARYQALGLAQTAVQKTLTDYVKLLNESGRGTRDATGNFRDLRRESREYLNIMIAQRELTGRTLEEQQREQAAQRSRMEIVVRQRRLQLESEDLQKQANQVTGAERERLLQEAQNRQNEAKRIEDLIIGLQNMGIAGQSAAAALDIAVKGVSNIPEMYNRFGTEFQNALRDYYLRGAGTMGKIGELYQKDINRTVKVFGMQIEYGADAAKALGLEVTDVVESTKLGVTNANTYNKKLDESRKRQDQVLQGMINDTKRAVRVQKEAAEMMAQLLKDKVLEQFSNSFLKAIDLMSKAIQRLARFIAEFVNKFSEKFGFDKINVLQFYSLEEIYQKLDEAKKQQLASIEAEAERVRLYEEMRDAEDKAVKLRAEARQKRRESEDVIYTKSPTGKEEDRPYSVLQRQAKILLDLAEMQEKRASEKRKAMNDAIAIRDASASSDAQRTQADMTEELRRRGITDISGHRRQTLQSDIKVTGTAITEIKDDLTTLGDELGEFAQIVKDTNGDITNYSLKEKVTEEQKARAENIMRSIREKQRQLREHQLQLDKLRATQQGPLGQSAVSAARPATASKEMEPSAYLGRIAGPESGGDYNLYAGQRPNTRPAGQNIPDMTIDKVVEQAGGRAVGKYQILSGYLLQHARDMGLDPSKTKFDAATQDAMAARMMRQNLDQLKKSDIDPSQRNVYLAWFLGGLDTGY